MEMPRKLTVSMLRVTVMQLRDMVESVTELRPLLGTLLQHLR